MPNTDKRVDTYIRNAPEYARPILERIRKAFHKGCPDVVETIKWSSPSFEHHGLLGSMSAFENHVRFGFWRGNELKDPEQLFRRLGDSNACAANVATLKETPTQQMLAGYVRRAAVLNRDLASGKIEKKPKRRTTARAAPATPADLAVALNSNAKARVTFNALAPSHKREYIEWITEAKRDATREKRLVTTIDWLSEGKRRNWKYER